MPLYEFNCRKCGHGFEELMTLAEMENGKLTCPACGSDQVERGFSTFATGANDGGGSAAGGGCGHGGFS